MRAIAAALLSALVPALLSAVAPARAFDAAACETMRERSNEDLAAVMRAAGGAPLPNRECFMRVALMRLGMLTEEEFAKVPLEEIRLIAAARHGFESSPDDPLPGPVLRTYGDLLLKAQPARHTDSVRVQALKRQFMERQAAEASAYRADDAGTLDGAGADPPPADAAEEISVGTTAGSLIRVPPEDVAPAATAGESWRADAELGVIAGAAHLPRNVPPPHPMARERQEAAMAQARLLRENGCAPRAAWRDPDLARNARVIEAAGLCVTTVELRQDWVGFSFTSVADLTNPDGPVWYLPHDNEEEAFDAAVYAVATYGGRMVAVDGDEMRFYRAVDPNRHFAMTAADAAPCRLNRPTPEYTRFVMGLFEGQRYVLSIHNNTRGGGVTVNVNNAKTRGFPVGSGRFADPDHLVYIAGPSRPSRDPKAQEWRDRLLGRGFNVVHETVTRGNSDCSFSNHVVLNDTRPYFNIEAVHGSRIQKQMVDALMDELGYRKVAGG